MRTEFHSVREIIDGLVVAPLDLAVIPNHMGINLCSVEGLSWTRQDDGQLVSLVIHFVPMEEPQDDRGHAVRKDV
jgi:hypothetical protein